MSPMSSLSICWTQISVGYVRNKQLDEVSCINLAVDRLETVFDERTVNTLLSSSRKLFLKKS